MVATRKRKQTGGRCPCQNAGSRKRQNRNRKNRKQRQQVTRNQRRQLKGGNLDQFYERPWLSTTPANFAERVGIAWNGEPQPVWLEPSIPAYKMLSNYPFDHYYNNNVLTSPSI